MPSSPLVFPSRDEHRAWLATQAAPPAGFRVATTRFPFVPREVGKPAHMTMTLIALDRPSPDFAAVFTRNAFPGAPIRIGRKRLEEPRLGAIVINNKISNVCAPDGEAAAEEVSAAVAQHLGLKSSEVLPSSTGVIGWTLPVEAMIAALPDLVGRLDNASVYSAAEGIVTTDRYPKIRRATVGNGSVVGIAKGAGMIEPDLATMLVFILTDLRVPREQLRSMLRAAVDDSFNCISVDSDTSTSDTVVAVSSGAMACDDPAAFEAGLRQVCRDLAGDVVRNGEGVRHVIRVEVTDAPDTKRARAIGKAIVNAPLFKCAVAGNDPNVGRLVQAIGKHVGAHAPDLDLSRAGIRMGGIEIFGAGVFRLNPEKETRLVEHLRAAELYASAPPKEGIFVPPIDFPPHERCVEIEVSLGAGSAAATVRGGDLTHEYVSENADYRS